MAEKPNDLKSLIFGSVTKHISDSDIEPAEKSKLFSLQIRLKFISWFIRVVVIGGIVLLINKSFDSRTLEMKEKENSLEIEKKRFSFGDSINSKYLDEYINYDDPKKRYRFLNHMRFTAPDTSIRIQYNKLYENFMKLEGEFVKSSIRETYNRQANNKLSALNNAIQALTKIESITRKKPTEVNEGKVKRQEVEVEQLLEELDSYNQAIENLSDNIIEPVVEPNKNDNIIEAWEEKIKIKQSFNKNRYIKHINDRNLIVGLIHTEVKKDKSVSIYLKNGTNKKPSFYKRKSINLGETVEFDIPNQKIKVKLVSVWEADVEGVKGFFKKKRKWAEIHFSFVPENNG